jgi:hypothetical protein
LRAAGAALVIAIFNQSPSSGYSLSEIPSRLIEFAANNFAPIFILFAGQHDFRNGHTCEAAFRELISDINENKNSRWINI